MCSVQGLWFQEHFIYLLVVGLTDGPVFPSLGSGGLLAINTKYYKINEWIWKVKELNSYSEACKLV